MSNNCYKSSVFNIWFMFRIFRWWYKSLEVRTLLCTLENIPRIKLLTIFECRYVECANFHNFQHWEIISFHNKLIDRSMKLLKLLRRYQIDISQGTYENIRFIALNNNRRSWQVNSKLNTPTSPEQGSLIARSCSNIWESDKPVDPGYKLHKMLKWAINR